ncbi:MAG TPA: hypothetical protein VGJ20_24880 [Xanthobacteraceae bacterium]|jgi:hypothetical protein
MRAKHLKWTISAMLLPLILAELAAIAHAQRGVTVPAQVPVLNPSSSLILPQAAENPVSPITPGTLPGTLAGPGTTVNTNPITGQPCIGAGSTAVTGGLIGNPTTPTTNTQTTTGQTTPLGTPPTNSVFGLNNGTTFGAC